MSSSSNSVNTYASLSASLHVLDYQGCRVHFCPAGSVVARPYWSVAIDGLTLFFMREQDFALFVADLRAALE